MKTALQAFEKELDAIREAGTWRATRMTARISRILILAATDFSLWS